MLRQLEWVHAVRASSDENSMSEEAFLRAAEAALETLESGLERAVDAGEIDLEIERQGNVLTLVFDDDSKIVVNSHAAAREIWVAARAGGFHYRLLEDRWVDGRSGEELFAALSRLLSQQAGVCLTLVPAPPA